MHITTWLRRPFHDAGRSAAALATGILGQLPWALIMAVPWLAYVVSSVMDILLSLVVPLPFVALLAPALTRLQRHRFKAVLDVDIPPATPGGGPSRGRFRRWLGAEATWRQLRYHLLAGPAVAAAGLVTLALWAAGGAAATIYVWGWGLPVDSPFDQYLYATSGAYLTAAGLALLCAAAWLTRALARLDSRLAGALLGPSRAERLARRVAEVTESRAGVVDAADAERRRIERDLHDGAQQRLVSMAVNLGLAKATLRDLPDDARKVIEEAHREAKEAIDELNHLVRGLHPAVLEDRGLDAALSGLAARAPLPVRVEVDLPSRPAPTVEAVAYFAVSEALTNVVKHAQASRADVAVRQDGAILLIVVSDDGIGGADRSRGTGLRGLARRVASVDGTLTLTSPAGGPTALTVELPCVP